MYGFPGGVPIPPTVAQPLPNVSAVVVRAPLIPQSASVADPRLVYTAPTVPRTAGLTPSYLPNQGGAPVNMPYSSLEGPGVEAANGLPGEGTVMQEPTPTPTLQPGGAQQAQQPPPEVLLLPSPPRPPVPLYKSPTTWLVVLACAIALATAGVLLRGRRRA